ncbi:hypothetical protein Gotur_017856 [Gossypium turneri]
MIRLKYKEYDTLRRTSFRSLRLSNTGQVTKPRTSEVAVETHRF